MKIALLGKGKMGRAIERLHNGEVVSLAEADVALEFSAPDGVIGHIEKACKAGKDLVIGTTGWEAHIDEVRAQVEKAQIGALYSPNFSIGMALFTEIAWQSKRLLEGYDVAGYEVHHRHKKDAPSGTGKRLGTLLGIEFSSVRCGEIPGTHTVVFDSAVDSIEITHRARSRDGFALGALRAAEWIRGKKGLFTLEDMLATLGL